MKTPEYERNVVRAGATDAIAPFNFQKDMNFKKVYGRFSIKCVQTYTYIDPFLFSKTHL